MTVKTILTKLADQFNQYYLDMDKNTDGQQAAAEAWAFAAAELRGAAATSEDLHVTPISPANIAEGAINLFIEYFDRWSDEYILEDQRDLKVLQERAKAAAMSDTLEGVEADVNVPEEKPSGNFFQRLTEFVKENPNAFDNLPPINRPKRKPYESSEDYRSRLEVDGYDTSDF